ncbi:MAG: TonB family protein [Terriglobales bacterium]|jgi:TonB family protein
MKYRLRRGVCVGLVCSTFVFAQNNNSSVVQNEPPPSNSGHKQPGPPNPQKDDAIDILTDTKGVDVHPYLDQVLPKIKANWYSQLHWSAYPPIRKKGDVWIDFRVMKNGKITKVKYHKSSGDVALDRAAYAGIVDSSPLPPLPTGFACQYLELGIHFYYNPAKGEVVEQKNTPTLPCVTTTIRTSGDEVTVPPS